MKTKKNISAIDAIFDALIAVSLLTVPLTFFKLTHVIDWPWFWVLAPTIIPCSLILGILSALVVTWVTCLVLVWLSSRK